MKVLPAGPWARLVELSGPDAAAALYAELAARRDRQELPGVGEVVPGAHTVLLVGTPDPTGPVALQRLAAQLSARPEPLGPGVPAGRDHELVVRYDGVDLAWVAERVQLSVAEVIERHAGGCYRVAFCGFAPGFAYLTGLDPALAVPRLAAPRARVGVGAVAIAERYTGVYPRSGPGGWRVLGSTDAPLFDPRRPAPALLAPGDRVRFSPAR